MSSSIKSFKWLLISWLEERYVCTDLLWLCTKRQFSGDQERELETLSRMTNRPTVDDDFSSFSDFFFFHCSKSNEKAYFRKATQSHENTVCVNCRHTTHRTKRGTKGQTSQVIDMQLCRLSITWYRIGWFSGVLFRGLPLWISLISRGFECLRSAEKLKLFLSPSVFMGSFSSYELFIILNSKHSLFIFF